MNEIMLIGKGGKIDESKETQKVEGEYMINQMIYRVYFSP